jgi:hypothetical protein
LANENTLGLGGSTVTAVVPGAKVEEAGAPNVKGLLVTAGLPSLSLVLAPKENLGTLLVLAVVVAAADVVVDVELVAGKEKLNADEDDVAGAAAEVEVAGFVDPNDKLGMAVAGSAVSAALVLVIVVVVVVVTEGVPKLKRDAALDDAGAAVEVLGVSAGLLNENPPRDELVEVAAAAVEAGGLVLPNVNGVEAVVGGLSEVAVVEAGLAPKVKGDELVVVAAIDVGAAGVPNEKAEAEAVDLLGALKVNADGAAAEVLVAVEVGVLKVNAEEAAGVLVVVVEVGVLKENADGAAVVLAVVDVGVPKANAPEAMGVVAAGVLKEIAEDWLPLELKEVETAGFAAAGADPKVKGVLVELAAAPKEKAPAVAG